MPYKQAKATKLFATHCVICGRLLVDANSVEAGMGPDCRKKYMVKTENGNRKSANELIHKASVAATNGNIEIVNKIADELQKLGYVAVSVKVRNRFKTGARNIAIEIKEKNGTYIVYTPFRRGDKEAFIEAWRRIRGRKYENGRNIVPFASKKQLWELLRKFFPKKYGTGPKGLFRIPEAAEKEKLEVQMELPLVWKALN